MGAADAGQLVELGAAGEAVGQHRRAVAETALLPAVRKAAKAAKAAEAAGAGRAPTVLADGFSCRTQLDQLADVHGTHLAELLAERLRPAARDGDS